MAYPTHGRDVERNARLHDSVYGAPNRFNAQDSVPSGRAVAIMFGAVVAVLLLIGLFTWTSSGDQTAGTQPAAAIEQSEPAPATAQ